MKVTLTRINDDFLFEGKNQHGKTILLDNTSEANAVGVSPMESILMAVAACSGIDIVTILKKQRQKITHFSTEIEGEQEELDEAKPFRKIKIKFILGGDVSLEKAQKAAQLSFDKYCSVSKTLEPGVEVEFSVEIIKV